MFFYKPIKFFIIMSGIIASLNFSIAYATSEITYNFKIPYAGAANLLIYNGTDQPIDLTQIQFTTTDCGVERGWSNLDLFPEGATLSKTQNPDGVHIDYTIMEPTGGKTLNSGETGSLNFSASQSNDINQLLMPPVQVSIETKEESSLQSLLIAGHCEGDFCRDPLLGKQLFGYYSDWDMYGRKYNAKDLPIGKINGVIYSFIGFDQEGNVKLLDPNSDAQQLPQIAIFQQQYPYLKTLLSFGGWTLSYNFSEMASKPDMRAKFVKNAVAAMKALGFNGIDIDWEYPVVNGAPGEPTSQTPQDAKNYVDLLTELRQALDAQAAKDKYLLDRNVKYYLTIAVSGGNDKIQAIQMADPNAWQSIQQVVDHIDVMSYDFHGGFDQGQAPSDFMSAMALDPHNDPTAKEEVLKTYNIIDAVNEYKAAGFEPQQIIVGIPAYGRLVSIDSDGETDGLYRTITGTPAGEYDNTGVFDYKCIMDKTTCHGSTLPDGLTFVNPDENRFGQYAKTPWEYSNKLFLTFDDNNSTKYKASFVKTQGLGGIMFWEFSGDLPVNDERSLTKAAYEGLK